MSITLLRKDRAPVFHQTRKLLELVAFPRLAPKDREAIIQHLHTLEMDQRVMNIQCTLTTDLRGNTKLSLEMVFNNDGKHFA